MQTSPLPRPNIDSLTGFRFVAALMVFVSHYAIPAARLRLPITNNLLHDLTAYLLFTMLVIALSIGLHIVLERPARRAIRYLLSPRRVSAVLGPTSRR